MSSILLAVTNVYNLIRGFFTFKLQRSLRFDGGSWLTRTPSSSVANTKVTISLWFKRTKPGNRDSLIMANGTSSNGNFVEIRSDGKFEINFRDRGNNGNNTYLVTTQTFTDFSAWYHLVLVFDASQSQNDRAKLYINGQQVTQFDYATFPSTATRLWFLRSTPHHIGAIYYNNQIWPDGKSQCYMADIHVVNGASGTPPDHTAFGEFKQNVWVPKQYTGSYGNNGFHLDFSQSATDDSSGNNNDFTAGGTMSGGSNGHDLVPDTPTNNFATLNPAVGTAGSNLSNGALVVSGNYKTAPSTIGVPTSGKYYSEIHLANLGMIGLCNSNGKTDTYPGATTNSFGLHNGSIYHNGSPTTITTWPADSTYRTIGMAIDRSNGKMFFHVNGTWTQYGDPDGGGAGYSIPSTVLNGTTFIFCRDGAESAFLNFGQDHTFGGEASNMSSPHTDAKGRGEFRYAPPTGYLAVCADNLTAEGTVPTWPLTAFRPYTQGLRMTYYSHSQTSHPTSKALMDALFNGATQLGSSVINETIHFSDNGTNGGGQGQTKSKPSGWPSNNYAVKFEGYLYAPTTGTYTFGIDSDDAADIVVNNNLVAHFYDGHGFKNSYTSGSNQVSSTISLTGGQYYQFTVRFEEASGGDGISVGWKKPGDSNYSLIPAANLFYT